MDCAPSTHGVMEHYGHLSGYIEKGFSASKNIHMNFYLQHHPCSYKKLTSTANSWPLYFYAGMVLGVCFAERDRVFSSCFCKNRKFKVEVNNYRILKDL